MTLIIIDNDRRRTQQNMKPDEDEFQRLSGFFDRGSEFENREVKVNMRK